MSTITYLIVGDYANNHYDHCALSSGIYIHPKVYHEKEHAIEKAKEVIRKCKDEIEEIFVMEINTSNGKVSSVWEQDSYD